METIRLLLVDDEEHFRNPLAKRLGKRGIAVLQASDGRSCLDLLAGNPVDVVVMDVKMPGMDGLEMHKRIKAMNKEPVFI